MAESTPHWAPIVVLLFLGTVFVTGVSLVVLLYGAARRSKRYAKIGGTAALTIVGCYLLLLCGVSLASSEKTLPPGGWKYFCELDCHIGYSVVGVQTTGVIGPAMKQESAHGQFVIVRLKVWFDEHTISRNRGDGPLTPNTRRIVLVDANRDTYLESSEAVAKLGRPNGDVGPLRQPLHPGQSFAKDLVFDVPRAAPGLRLLITEDDPETFLVIGHENSLLHRKIYLSLDSAPNIISQINSLESNR